MKTVGYITVRAPSSMAFSTDVNTILSTTALVTSMGGTVSHDSSKGSFNCILKCPVASGDTFNMTFKRDSVMISNDENDTTLATIES